MKIKLVLCFMLLSASLWAAKEQYYSSRAGNGAGTITFNSGNAIFSIPAIPVIPVVAAPAPETKVAGVTTIRGKGKETVVVDAGTEEPSEPEVTYIPDPAFTNGSNPYLPSFLQPIARGLNKVLP